MVGRELIARVDAGGNMAAPLVAELLGGTPFLGFISAVAFATILAVVAGLVLSASAAMSHDVWSNIIRKGKDSEHEEVVVAKIAALTIGAWGLVHGSLDVTPGWEATGWLLLLALSHQALLRTPRRDRLQ